MNKLTLDKGRIKQKLQTRSLILDSAKRLLSEDQEITLEQVAAEAKVSRATIYRYYPNIDALLTEASLDIHHIPPEELGAAVAGLPIEDRILHLQRHYNQLAQAHETGFRRYLGATLAAAAKDKKSTRGARRVKALETALSAFEGDYSEQELRDLVNIASVLMGIDALVVCKDVCGLNNSRSDRLLAWGIEMILKGMASEK